MKLLSKVIISRYCCQPRVLGPPISVIVEMIIIEGGWAMKDAPRKIYSRLRRRFKQDIIFLYDTLVWDDTWDDICSFFRDELVYCLVSLLLVSRAALWFYGNRGTERWASLQWGERHAFEHYGGLGAESMLVTRLG